jgi:hypothetical protein
MHFSTDVLKHKKHMLKTILNRNNIDPQYIEIISNNYLCGIGTSDEILNKITLNSEDKDELRKCEKKSKYFTVHWTRHAESCSNYSKGQLSDEIVEQTILGYNKLNKSVTPIKKTIYEQIINIPSSVKGSIYYHPNLTYIGIQHGILLGKNFIKKFNHDYDIVFVSPTFRTIFTALMALRGTNKIIYVVPYINEISNNPVHDYQNNPVPSNILKNCVLFFKDWLEHNWIEYFDDIELMDKLIEIKHYYHNKNNNIIQIIDNILTCKTNNKMSNINLKCNIKKNIEKLILLLDNDKYTDIQLLKNILNIKFIRGPKVNFSIYEYYENNYNSDINSPSLDKFYDIILPKAYKMQLIPNKSNIKILCITHGSLMRTEFKRIYNIEISHPMNTEVIEEIRNNCLNKGKIATIYKPIKIRSNYENFEELNGNICRSEGLKGILNIAIWNNNDRGIIPNLAMIKGSIAYNPIDYADNDVKFYFENRNKYQENRNNIISGGNVDNYEKYHEKYLKYKFKYLQIKYK